VIRIISLLQVQVASNGLKRERVEGPIRLAPELVRDE
jgi:hypothetical protein